MVAQDPSRPVRPSTRRHRTRTLVIVAIAAAVVAGVVGLGAGGVGGFMLSSGSGGSGGSRAEQNVAEGCAVLERIESDLPFEESEFSLETPQIFEITAIASSFMAAGTADPARSDLYDAGRRVQEGLNTFDVEEVNAALEALGAECG
ncbi:hypothetical protein ACFQRD_07625 [Brachybacterium sp. GCM10030268]|uniref:hypothetical protein n=1 Tax=Brachybacterium sp. GCM10030268 TaxID=3273382 RepID=UPI003618F7D6